jgi:hypothetical protein
MEQKFIEMAKTIFNSIDHYRESGREDKFNIDSIAEYLQRQFLLQQTPCKTLLPPDFPTFEQASNAIEDKSYREFAGEWDRKNGARLMYAQIKKMLTGGK